MARILLVDDEPSIRFLYSDILADHGHEVVTAQSGGEAMQVIQKTPLDLVVLDIKLGPESGLSVLQQMVRDHPRLPVMLLTAYFSFQDDYTSWLADSYIIKSSDPSEFLEAVQRLLKRDDSRARSQQIYQTGFGASTSL
jgi:DNA-binding response OmpR family regulator